MASLSQSRYPAATNKAPYQDLVFGKCACGHYWHEHHAAMGGCQHFNISKVPPYCQCDGYRPRKEKEK